MRISLTVNGEVRDVEADGRMLLVELLRDGIGLKGPRIGCLTGDCGACTILLDGALSKSCLVLAIAAEGAQIETVEVEDPLLDRLRQSFIDQHAFQCGYCTSGMMMTARDLLSATPQPDEAQVREGIGGNLCRCTGYDSIVDAILAIAAASEEPA